MLVGIGGPNYIVSGTMVNKKLAESIWICLPQPGLAGIDFLLLNYLVNWFHNAKLQKICSIHMN